jgi:hypothetical protein
MEQAALDNEMKIAHHTSLPLILLFKAFFNESAAHHSTDEAHATGDIGKSSIDGHTSNKIGICIYI